MACNSSETTQEVREDIVKAEEENVPEDGAKGSNISIIKKHLPSGKCFLRCWGESERVMRAELPGGSSGRRCRRAVEVRVEK